MLLGLLVFLNEPAQDCAYFIDIEEKSKEYNRNLQKNYSLAITDAKSLAPTVIQMAAFTLIFSMSMVAEVSSQLKTLAFRSFHTSHIISMARLRIAFFGTPGVVAMFNHQVSALSLGLQAFGVKSG